MEEKKMKHQVKDDDYNIIRILGNDIPGNKRLIVGLTNIKGISWSVSNALCNVLKLDKNKRVDELTPEEISKIENISLIMDNIPSYLKNRQKDYDTGKDLHLVGSDLTIRYEFDIKRLKKIKSYKGIRHQHNLPVRGQRTKSHFRKNKKSTGIAKKKK